MALDNALSQAHIGCTVLWFEIAKKPDEFKNQTKNTKERIKNGCCFFVNPC